MQLFDTNKRFRIQFNPLNIRFDRSDLPQNYSNPHTIRFIFENRMGSKEVRRIKNLLAVLFDCTVRHIDLMVDGERTLSEERKDVIAKILGIGPIIEQLFIRNSSRFSMCWTNSGK